MKILYHHRTAAQDGQSVHIEEMLKAFRALGHTVKVVGPRVRADSFGKSSQSIGALKALVPSFLYELLEVAYSVRAYMKLKKAYKEFQPDFLYERYNLNLLAGAWLKKRTGIPYILEINSPLAEERNAYGTLSLYKLARSIEDKCWRTADVCIPVSKVLAKTVEGRHVDPHHIVPMHNGIDPDKFDDKHNDLARDELNLKGKIVLGFTGFVREWHKLDRIIRLIADQSKNHNIHLLVIGDGPAKEDCIALAKELEIENHVTFLGLVPRDKVAHYTQAFDIALQPAVTYYASPLKIFEYLAIGIPCIAPRQDNIEEILTHEHDSILFDTEDNSSLEEAVMTLVQDPKMRSKLGENALTTLQDNQYYWSSNAEHTVDLARTIIKARSTSGKK